ncbi:MAG: MBL fold metallo-hydrolase [Chloroflexi bacterium]|nr:MBL fold metallo-hydrolase [Chloroflexota bacterium]
MHPWREVADRAFVRRYPFLDQTIGAVVGRERVLVVDTRATTVQARELIEDLRQLTRLPWVVTNTHVHFDHAFGNAAFRPCEIWAHEGCADTLQIHGPAQRENVVRWVPDLRDELGETPLDPPDRTFATAADLDLGGRVVELRHLGRGHTDHDVVVRVPDSGVVFAGDLVEQGAPPGFEDSFLLEWPGTLGLLLDIVGSVIVPGHGDPVGREFVEAQLADIAYLAETARRTWPELRAAGHDPRGHAPHDLVDAAARHLGWPTEPVHAALGRGLAQASGRLV